jgi:hypothetical protein
MYGVPCVKRGLGGLACLTVFSAWLESRIDEGGDLRIPSDRSSYLRKGSGSGYLMFFLVS